MRPCMLVSMSVALLSMVEEIYKTRQLTNSLNHFGKKVSIGDVLQIKENVCEPSPMKIMVCPVHVDL